MKKWLIVLLVLVMVSAVVFYFVCNSRVSDETGIGSADNREHEIAFQPDTLEICSFNIQFLGSFKKRDNTALADILKNFDIVVVQELVAPPFDGVYPDETAFTGDNEAALFFNAMTDHGFAYLLSEEDTGTGEKIHQKSTSTEWFVTFYKPATVAFAADLPSGFLAEDRSDHPDYERVPYAFAFRSANNTLDFVLISVHLQPGDRPAERRRRAHELQAIGNWINTRNTVEKDFIILGDMNIYDREELDSITPAGYLSLNDECRPTNTLSISDKGAPYDHVMYSINHTLEIDINYDLTVVNLVEIMRPYWTADDPYPGDPYDHNLFKQYYSDHFPVVFRMITPLRDDDGQHM